jgi:hypothetical protein
MLPQVRAGTASMQARTGQRRIIQHHIRILQYRKHASKELFNRAKQAKFRDSREHRKERAD